MNEEVKKYIDERVEDLVIQRSASYFKVMECMIAQMNKNILEIMKLMKKIIK